MTIKDENFHEKWYIINKKGEIVMESPYGQIIYFDDNIFQVWSDGKSGFMDKNGKIIIEPRFDIVHDFSEGLARFKENGKWGFIDKNLEVVIPAQFESVGDFVHGLADIYVGGSYAQLLWGNDKTKKGYINKNGEYIWKPTN
ncbi:MAG: WG repeat-containing protein [Bacteroidota bacterium]